MLQALKARDGSQFRRQQGHDDLRACATQGGIAPTLRKKRGAQREQAPAARFPFQLRGRGGASGVNIPKQIQHI